jgi:hypothetical protein
LVKGKYSVEKGAIDKTVTISEMRKTNCNPNGKAYIDVLPQDDIYISEVKN